MRLSRRTVSSSALMTMRLSRSSGAGEGDFAAGASRRWATHFSSWAALSRFSAASDASASWSAMSGRRSSARAWRSPSPSARTAACTSGGSFNSRSRLASAEGLTDRLAARRSWVMGWRSSMARQAAATSR